MRCTAGLGEIVFEGVEANERLAIGRAGFEFLVEIKAADAC